MLELYICLRNTQLLLKLESFVQMKLVRFSSNYVLGGRPKEPILNETKSPILETGQNRRFSKREQIAMKIVSLIKASWPNYQ